MKHILKYFDQVKMVGTGPVELNEERFGETKENIRKAQESIEDQGPWPMRGHLCLDEPVRDLRIATNWLGNE